jgi:dethiobiotin synthetase/adenosylmethionine--8-amino-7-oxononanoate aminotransferase
MSHIALFLSKKRFSTQRLYSSFPSISLETANVCLWGSNTGVGKTVFSAGLAAAAQRAESPCLYLKPVQTGFPKDSDALLVASVLQRQPQYGEHASQLLASAMKSVKDREGGIQGDTYFAKTLFAWQTAVSPHLAVEMEGRRVTDEQLLRVTAQHMNEFSQKFGNSKGLCIVETAGGVASPGPSGSLLCDVLQPLQLPALLVGDGRLGGISATISAADTLTLHGYTVPIVVLMDDGELGNWKAIQRHLPKGTQVIPFPRCLPPPQECQEKESLIDENLNSWLKENATAFDTLLIRLQEHHEAQRVWLSTAAHRATRVFWWPFTQHGLVESSNTSSLTVIAARSGENFVTLSEKARKENKVALDRQYDACASWWTQGVTKSGLPLLSRAIGQASARYGHVYFPQTVHQPALALAEDAISLIGGDWASRVFFSDDGSTAVEVALKMAFRKYLVDQGLIGASIGKARVLPTLHVLGVDGAYHGDTLGAMDAVASSPFNGPLQMPWNKERGIYLDPPTVSMQNGLWRVTWSQGSILSENYPTAEIAFAQLNEVFSGDRSKSALSEAYSASILSAIEAHERDNIKIGACIIEPVLQGAGGMHLVDPEFHRAMVEICKTKGIPVIFDEVFSGLWRLGVVSCSQLLGVSPDIGCYAKLLTGGVVPMALTLASEAVFEAFKGDEKTYALLHGHSYTAHPIGCAAALEALRLYQDPEFNPNLCNPDTCCRTSQSCESCKRLKPLWDDEIVNEISHQRSVQRVVALGTVVAVELVSGVDSGGQPGYGSNAAAKVVQSLLNEGINARPLGNVVYIMVTPMTDRTTCHQLLTALQAAINSAA